MTGIKPPSLNSSGQDIKRLKARRKKSLLSKSRPRSVARLFNKLLTLAHFADGRAADFSKGLARLATIKAKNTLISRNPAYKIIQQLEAGEVGTEDHPLKTEEFRFVVKYAPAYRNFDNVIFKDKVLLGGMDLRGYSFRNARMHEVNLEWANLNFADFRGANIEGAIATGASLSEANLARANLTRAYLFEADMGSANLRGANLTRANLGSASLNNASCQGADFTDVKRMGGLTCMGTSFVAANFIRANLKGMQLRKEYPADFTRANFTDANVPLKRPRGLDLSGFKFVEVDFTRANIRGIDFSWANLERAKLEEAIIDDKTKFSRAKLKGTCYEDKTRSYDLVMPFAEQLESNGQITIPLASFQSFGANEINDTLRKAFEQAQETAADTRYVNYWHDEASDALVIQPIKDLSGARHASVVFFTHAMPGTSITAYYHVTYNEQKTSQDQIDSLLKAHAEGMLRAKKSISYDYKDEYSLENSAPNYQEALNRRFETVKSKYYFAASDYDLDAFDQRISWITKRATSSSLSFSKESNAITDSITLHNLDRYDEGSSYFFRIQHEIFHLMEYDIGSLTLAQKLGIMRFFRSYGEQYPHIKAFYEEYGEPALKAYSKGNKGEFDYHFRLFFRNMNEEFSRVFNPNNNLARFKRRHEIPQELLEKAALMGYTGQSDR